MTVRDTRRVNRIVYRVGLLVSATWLVVTAWWIHVVLLALAEVDLAAPLLEQVSVFDRYETNIVRGALVGCLLFVTRVAMFLQWPDARLLWRSWRK